MATTWGAIKRKPFVIPFLEKRRQLNQIKQQIAQNQRIQRLQAMSREQRRAAAMESRRRFLNNLPNWKKREILLSKKQRLYNARRSKARFLAKNPPKPLILPPKPPIFHRRVSRYRPTLDEQNWDWNQQKKEKNHALYAELSRKPWLIQDLINQGFNMRRYQNLLK